MNTNEPVPTDPELWRQAERLRALARTLIADSSAAEDVVQDAWVAALRRPGAARESLAAWLSGTVRQLAGHLRRREKQRAEVERRGARVEALDGPEEAVARAELQQELWRALLELAEPYRSAVILRHLDQLEPAEIARSQGCSREAARQRVARGLEQLRKRFDAEHGGRERWCLLFTPFARGPSAHAPLAAAPPVLGGIVMGSKIVLASLVAATAAALLWLARGLERDPHDVASSAPSAPATLAPLATASDEREPVGSEERVALATEADPERGEPALADTTSLLRGRVLDSAGSPVAGARVTLRRRELSGFNVFDLAVARTFETQDESTTDVDGAFAFTLDPGLAVDVCAEKQGFFESMSTERHAGQTIELVLGTGFRLHGRVRRERDGKPVVLANVRAFRRGGPRWGHEFETRTDLDGRYELRVPWGENVFVDVLPLADQPQEDLPADFGSTGEATIDVQVFEGLVVEGRVTAADTGRPIAGATIGEGWTFRRTATTDANGEYRLAGFGELGTYELFVRAPGFGMAVDSPALVDARRRRLDFTLPPAHAASGRIVDERGQAIEGAYVAAVGKGRSSTQDWSSARTDAEGRFTCTDLTPTLRHALIVHHPSFATAVYDFPLAERATASLELGELVLHPPGLIAGRVRDSAGRAVAGATITLHGANRDRRRLVTGQGANEPEKVAESYVDQREVLTDEDGRFWFGSVAAGDWTLAGRAPGRAPLPESALALDADKHRTDVVLVFGAGATLSGRVVDEQGVALAGVKLYAESEPAHRSGSTRASVRSGADGSFELRDLPDGAYTLEIFPWFDPTLASPTSAGPWLYSVLEHVATDDGPIEFVVRRGECIQGVLRNAAGEPLHGHSLAITDANGQSGLGTTTDSEGRFTLGVEPGTTWTIQVSGPDGDAAFRTLLVRPNVPAGTRELELRLPK